MPDITLQEISVMVDGGSHEGRLVFADGHLAAVFARVTPEETAGGHDRATGWFLEGGFGPCSSLMSVDPPVFAGLEDALDWVLGRLEARSSPS